MKHINMMAMMLAISLSMYAPEGFEGPVEEPGQEKVEPSNPTLQQKESWAAWLQRKGQDVVNKGKSVVSNLNPLGDVGPYPGDWDYKGPTGVKSTEPVNAIGLKNVEPAEVKNLVTETTAKALGLHVEPTVEPIVEPVADKPFVLNMPPEPAKPSAWQRLTSWFGIDVSDYEIDMGDIEDDVMNDLESLGVTNDDLANVGIDTNIAEGCKLTEESLAKIKKIDALLKSWKLAPLRAVFNIKFPIDDFAKLVSDLATSETIPVDIGSRIEALVKQIPLMPKIVRSVVTAVGISLAISRVAAVDYLVTTVPALEGFKTAVPDIAKAQELWDATSDKPEALRRIYNEKLESLKIVNPLLKAVNDATQGKAKALEKTERINRIITNVFKMLFLIAVAALVLSIIDWGKENRTLHKIVETIGPIFLAATMGGVAYGSMRLGGILGKANKPGVEPIVEPSGEPAGI